MTWVAAGVTVAGTIYSGVSANKAGKEAKKQAENQQRLLSEDLEERKRIARRQEGIYGPIEEQIAAAAAAKGIDPIRAGIVRQRVGTEFNAADRNILTMIGNRGVSSGLGASLLGASQMNRARAMASGILGEYQNKDAMRLQLLSRYNPLQLGEFKSQGLRGMSEFYGQEAARARAAEQQGWQSAAQGVMNVGLMYALRQQPKQGVAAPPIGDPSMTPLTSVSTPSNSVLPQAPGVIPTPTAGTIPQAFGVSNLPSFSSGGWGVMPTQSNFGIYGR